MFVTSSIDMYFWIDSFIASRICTVIFLFEIDGPVSLTSLRLNLSPDSSRKYTRNSTTVACPTKAAAPSEPAHNSSLKRSDDSSGACAFTGCGFMPVA